MMPQDAYPIQSPAVHRKHLRRREAPGQPRFLTFSCHNRLQLLSDDHIKLKFTDSLGRAKERFHFKLYAWVIMPEHVHLLLCPDLSIATMEQTLTIIKSRFARSILEQWRRADSHWLNHIIDSSGKHRFWLRGGGFDRNIRDEEEFWNTVQYINSNPVARKLVDRAAEYPWSSARWWADRSEDRVGIDHPTY